MLQATPKSLVLTDLEVKRVLAREKTRFTIPVRPKILASAGIFQCRKGTGVMGLFEGSPPNRLRDKYAPFSVDQEVAVKESWQVMYSYEYNGMKDGVKQYVPITDLISNFYELPLKRIGAWPVADLPDQQKFYVYKEFEEQMSYQGHLRYDKIHWELPASMPKEATRILLKCTAVEFRPLCDLNEYDLRCEGYTGDAALEEFKAQWNKRHRRGEKFEDNPWCFCHTMEVVSCM